MEYPNRFVLFVLLSLVLSFWVRPVVSQEILSGDRAAQKVIVGNVKAQDGAISGELLNRSSRPLQDIQLQIRYTWLWDKEFRPGSDELGTAVYHTVRQEIAPGGKILFQYRPPQPLPSRPDGHFETTVTVAGFTEIIR